MKEVTEMTDDVTEPRRAYLREYKRKQREEPAFRAAERAKQDPAYMREYLKRPEVREARAARMREVRAKEGGAINAKQRERYATDAEYRDAKLRLVRDWRKKAKAEREARLIAAGYLPKPD